MLGSHIQLVAPVLDNTDRPFPLSQKVLLDCAALKHLSFVLGVILCREGDESLLPFFLPPIGWSDGIWC